MTTYTVTLVAFKGNVNDIYKENSTIVIYETDTMSNAMIQCENCIYEGTCTNVPQNLCMELLTILEKSNKNIEDFLCNYTTVCVLINDNVLYLDMLNNADNFTKPPEYGIANAELIQKKLKEIFPAKNLKYLKQSNEWYDKRMKSFKQHEEITKSVNKMLYHLI